MLLEDNASTANVDGDTPCLSDHLGHVDVIPAASGLSILQPKDLGLGLSSVDFAGLWICLRGPCCGSLTVSLPRCVNLYKVHTVTLKDKKI